MEILKRIVTFLLSSALLLNASQLDKILGGGGSFDAAGPSNIKTQTRGYYTFGSAAVRHDLGGTIRPFNISMPKYHSGCGGIDMTFGAFSYLGLDMIVQKLQKIASAAPAFVFNMALSTLCKDCQQIMSELENIANIINGLNFDTCNSAINWGKSIGAAMNDSLAVSDDSLTSIKNTLEDTRKGMETWANNLNATIHCEPGSSVGICTSSTNEQKRQAAIEKERFQGSLIKKVFRDDSGFLEGITEGNDSDSQYAYWMSGLTPQQAEDLFRNMFGDLYGYVDPENCMASNVEEGGGTKPFNVAYVIPRMDAHRVVGFFFGETWDGEGGKLYGLPIEKETKLDGQCPNMMGKPKFAASPYELPLTAKAGQMYESVKERLDKILKDMGSGTQDNMKEHAEFMNQLNYPVYRALNIASITQDELLVSYIADVVITKEVVHLIRELMEKAREMVQVASTNDTTATAPIEWFKDVEERIILIETYALQKDKETAEKMEARVAQIFVLEDVMTRFKGELVRKGLKRVTE